MSTITYRILEKTKEGYEPLEQIYFTPQMAYMSLLDKAYVQPHRYLIALYRTINEVTLCDSTFCPDISFKYVTGYNYDVQEEDIRVKPVKKLLRRYKYFGFDSVNDMMRSLLNDIQVENDDGYSYQLSQPISISYMAYAPEDTPCNIKQEGIDSLSGFIGIRPLDELVFCGQAHEDEITNDIIDGIELRIPVKYDISAEKLQRFTKVNYPYILAIMEGFRCNTDNITGYRTGNYVNFAQSSIEALRCKAKALLEEI